MTRRRSSRVCIRTSQSLQRSVLFATSHRRVPALSAVSTPARVIKESIKSIKLFHPPHLRRGQSPHALATGLAGCTHFALAMSHTRASHAAWTRPPSVFSSSSRVIARASTVADSTHGRGAVARVTAEAPRAPFARARTASVVVVVIVIARGSDGRSSPQGPQGGGYRPIRTLRRHPDRRSVFRKGLSHSFIAFKDTRVR